MRKILISACLLGERVRFDAQTKAIVDERIKQWLKEGRLLSICPEMAGGLAVPRAPAEIQASSKVITVTGLDVSQEFAWGAQRALELAQRYQCTLALLKARSPSCGLAQIYDGSFKRHLITGDGISASLLKQNDIQVFTEFQIDELAKCL